MSTWSEFPWNYQGETSFSIEESTNSRLRKLFMSSQWPLFFFFQFLGVWRFCLYLWVPYNLGHAFLTLFTVAALLFWCFLSRLVLEANERRKVLDGGFLGGFFTFQGCAYIYGFLITWGIPFHLCSQWQRFYFGIFYLDSSWKRMKEGKCWPDDFSVVSLLFKDVLISMGSL